MKNSEEIWKDIPGYEGKYQASNMGRIKSLSRKVPVKSRSGTWSTRTVQELILKPGKYCKSGHLSVVLGKRTPGKPVHQLILKTFVGPSCPGMEVLHKNGDPTDNRLENLHYGTRTENILDVYRQGKAWRKLTIDDVEAIRFGLSTGIKGRELASMFNVSEDTISKIKKGVSFSWL